MEALEPRGLDGLWPARVRDFADCLRCYINICRVLAEFWTRLEI